MTLVTQAKAHQLAWGLAVLTLGALNLINLAVRSFQ